MAWETRERGTRYYTRTYRLGGRRVREYVGRGPLGEQAAREDAARRQARAQVAETRRRQRAADRVLHDLLVDLETRTATLTAAALDAAGYHRLKRGVWRKRRG